MTSSVAGQGENPAPTHANVVPLRPDVAYVADGKMVVNKAALRNRVALSPVKDTVAEEWTMAHLIRQIRALLARIARFFGLGRGAPSVAADDGRGTPPSEVAAHGAPIDGGVPGLQETAESISLEGVPPSVLERVASTVNGMVDSSVGEHLPRSLKAALATPELAQSAAPLRVLLQNNCEESRQAEELLGELRENLNTLLAPYAEQYELTEDEAYALFVSDVRAGGGVISTIADSKGELVRFVSEVDRLEGLLASLAKARGQICATALNAGVYDKNELASLLEKYEVASNFLQEIQSAPLMQHDSAENVVSLSTYRRRDTFDGTAPKDVEAALEKLVKAGHLGELERKRVEEAAVQHAVVVEPEPMEFEMSGDDLSSFGMASTKPPKPTP